MQRLKKVLLVVIFAPIGMFFGAILIVGMLPVLLFFCLYILYLKIFRELRGDPKNPFVLLIDKKEFDNTQELEGAIKYFEELTNAIAHKGGARASRVKESKMDYEGEAEFINKLLTYERELTTKSASISIQLQILEMTSEDGDVFYVSPNNDEDTELISSIIGNIVLKSGTKDRSFNVRLEVDELASYFCIGVLQGGGWYNEKTKQFWSELLDYNIWLVRYNKNGKDFGLRKAKSLGKARENWFDQRVST